MRINKEESRLKNLKDRINVLSRGIVLPDESIPIVHVQSTRGGAGPQGVVCYFGGAPGNHKSQINLQIFPKSHYMAQYALPTKWWEENEPKGGDEKNHGKDQRKILRTDNGIFLEEVLPDWGEISPDDIIVRKSLRARLHPYRTYATCLYRSCRHLEKNVGCRYCTNALHSGKFNLPKRQPDDLSIEFLKLAMSISPIRSANVTSGTFETPERTAREVLTLARRIREETGLEVHIQIEPIFDLALLKELSDTADSIAIPLEFFDEKVHQKICPGKATAFTQDDYLRSWEMAVSCFGRGKVWNIMIIGFDEDYEVTLRGIEKAAQMGVITSFFLLRVGSPNLGEYVPSYIGREDELVQIHQELGKILVKNSINASAENPGCLGCHGCNATKEAIAWAQAVLKPATNGQYSEWADLGQAAVFNANAGIGQA